MGKTKPPKWPLFKESGVRMTGHRNGQWCKKIAGTLHYFGAWADAHGALRRYREQAEALHAGRDAPTSPTATGCTVADMAEDYLAHREPDVTASRERTDDRHDTAIGPAQFNRYRRAGRILVDHLGEHTDANSLTPRDWMRLKAALVKVYKPTTLAGVLTDIRTVATWAHNAELLDAAPRFGPDFAIRNVRRVQRRQRRATGGKMLDAETIRALLAVARPQVQTCIMLGINCAFYSADCSDLVVEGLDLDNATLDFARFKTDVDRVAILWPEVVEGIRWSIDNRPTPVDPTYKNRVFITARGRLWAHPQAVRRDDEGRLITPTHTDYLSQEFRRLFDKAGLDRPKGCGFSWLRHTSYTVMTRTRDTVSRDLIAGHAGAGMQEHYLEQHDLDPLRRMADYTRAWLWPQDAEEGGDAK